MGQGRAHTLTLRSHRAWFSGPQDLGVEVVPEAPKIPRGQGSGGPDTSQGSGVGFPAVGQKNHKTPLCLREARASGQHFHQ